MQISTRRWRGMLASGLLALLILLGVAPRPADAQPVDIVFVVDLSGSFGDDLPVFKAQALPIMNAIQTVFPDTRFALTSFKDYPVFPYGGFSDYPHLLHQDFTFDPTVIDGDIQGFFASGGSDFRESQLAALFQAASGAGQAPWILPGQNVNFRPGVIKIFVLWTDASFHFGCGTTIPSTVPCEAGYPGPSFDETVAAILALDPPMVVGLSSGGGGVPDLELIAAATDAVAPEGGVDCNDNGTIDIPAGAPLVCTIGGAAEGIAEAIQALIGGAAGMPPRALKEMAVADLMSLLPTGDSKLDKQIEKAKKNIEDSLDEDLWVDDSHLDPKKGKKVFDEEKKAVKELEKILDDVEGELAEFLQAVKDKLLDADATLAAIAIDEAQEACDATLDDKDRAKCQKEVDKALEEFAKAEQEREAGDCDKAIDKYKKAWDHAQKGLKKADPEEGEGEDPPPTKRFEAELPATFELEGNYPNPFNPRTTIRFHVPEAAPVRLAVFDALGREVEVLVDGFREAGTYDVPFEAGTLPSGVYFYQLRSTDFVQIKQMVLMK